MRQQQEKAVAVEKKATEQKTELQLALERRSKNGPV